MKFTEEANVTSEGGWEPERMGAQEAKMELQALNQWWASCQGRLTRSCLWEADCNLLWLSALSFTSVVIYAW